MVLEQQEETTIKILEEFNQNLKKMDKASRPQIVIQQVLYWTNCHPPLISIICQLILQSESTINTNKEKEYVEHLVQQYLIKSWQTQPEAEPIKEIHAQLINNQKCDPFWLLLNYKKIVTSNGFPYNNSSNEHQELLRLNLVIKRLDKLIIYNRIYQEVFNTDLLENTLDTLRPYARKITAWLDSDCQDESKLLRGKDLNDALNWTEGKGNLNSLEDKFLIHSQVFNLRGA